MYIPRPCLCLLVNKPNKFTRRIILHLGEQFAAPSGRVRMTPTNKVLETAGDWGTHGEETSCYLVPHIQSLRVRPGLSKMPHLLGEASCFQ